MLALQSFLANAVFVVGRNLGPVIFMHQCGANQLTGVLFISGSAILVVSPAYGRLCSGRLAAEVNTRLTVFCMIALGLLAVPLVLAKLSPDRAAAASPALRWLVDASLAVRWPVAYVMYVAQDLLTMLLMMQSASLAQATLNAYSAKRLIGLVQLGCSMGAIVTGLLVGPLAKAIGTETTCLVQVGILLVSLVPNAFIVRIERSERPRRRHSTHGVQAPTSGT